jgi:hypothetical protein
MNTIKNGRLVIAVALVVCGLGESVAFAESPKNESAFPGTKLSTEERARIAAMSEYELANLTKTGTRGQQEAAVRALMAKDKGDVLLAIAKRGPPGATDIVIELYVPMAMPESNTKTKESVEAYLVWLEDQIKSESPVVPLGRVVRCLGRMIRRDPTIKELEPPYQYQRIVGDLVWLLKNKGTSVGDAVVSLLGNSGGYTPEQAQEVIAALETYKQVLSAQPVDDEQEKLRQALSLTAVGIAIKRVNSELERLAKAASGQRVSPTKPGADVSNK